MPERIDVLVIGTGSIGERHVRCFQQTERVNVAICELNNELRDDVSRRYQLKHAVGDLDAAIAQNPAAAVICTPAHLHIPMAVRLAEAGIHLLIEKPLSIGLEGIGRLQDVVAEQETIVSIAYVLRSNPILAQMRQTIHDGRFGRPLQLVYTGGQHFPFYRPAYREIYYTDRATGGGAIQDGLTHLINAGEWLVGPVTAVAADAEHLLLEGVDVEDTVHVIARHGSVLASYAMNQHQAPNESTISVICEEGTVRYEAHRHRWRWTTHPEEDWHDELFDPLERDATFVAQAHAFLDAVEKGARPLCTLDEGLQTLRVNLAILKAADTYTWQSIGT